MFHRQQSGGFHRSCPPGAEARLRRLAARTDGARGQRKQQGVYGARGWQVHSVRGQLGRCGLCVCGPGPRFCGAAFRCPLDTALVPQELCWGTGPFPLWLHRSEAAG